VNNRIRSIAYWTAPPLLMLALYWPGLTSWFQKDDFVWLGLRAMVHGPRDLLWALFAPLAQGTIRTLSERAVFLSFTSLFGLHAPPFRLLAFVTGVAAISMLSAVVTKLTGSRAAGFWAAILWTVNASVAIPLAWTAEYYEVAWPFCVLLTFWLLLRYVETGERRFFVAQCATFVLGFFVIELNVVYPAIAAVYALASPQARKSGLFQKVIPLLAISLLYTVVHIYFAPLPAGGPYKLHWDFQILHTLTTYWGWALGPGNGRLIGIRSTFIRSTMVWILTAGLFALLFRRPSSGTASGAPIQPHRVGVGDSDSSDDGPRSEPVHAAFFPAWFLITLAPLLPLRGHISPEYLTGAALGLAMWGGWAMVQCWRAGPLSKLAAVLMLIIYSGFSIAIGQAHLWSFHDRSQRIRAFVKSVVAAEPAGPLAQPARLVLLEGVSTEMFTDVIYNRAFRLYGIDDLYLVPENRAAIAADPYFATLDSFFADPTLAHKAVRHDRAVVYDMSTGLARVETAEYAKSVKADEIAARVETGSDLFADQLGDGWYPPENGFRWMGKRATVTLAVPSQPGREGSHRLYITGYAPARALKSGPIALQVTIGGVARPTVQVRNPDAPFAFDFEVPPRLGEAQTVEVTVDLDRTFTAPPDPRIFGLVFVSFEIR
jgi:Dolichyl-phosphate-mannose-protein mannosyltransferase